MSWHKTTIRGDRDARDSELKAFVNKLLHEFHKAGSPPQFDVWKGQTTSGDYVLYLSPIASTAALGLKDWQGRIACCEQPRET
jgi:hypothetical protein